MTLGDPERLRRLQSLTDTTLETLDLEELVAGVAERTREALDADACVLLLLDDADELVVRAGSGLVGRLVVGARLPADEAYELLLAPELASTCGVPLVAHGDVLGVLVVGARAERSLGAEAVELLQLAAERMAVAIHHARSFEAVRDARERLEHLQSITDAALAHLELDELLAVLLPRVREILAADTCAVLLLDEDGNELVARAALGIEEEVEQGVRIPVGGGFAGRVASERMPIVLPDLDHAHVLNPILREKGLKSLLGVPLLVRGEAIGVLHVGTLAYRDFTARDVELLQVVAERVALAIERAQLHEQTVALDRMKANFVAIASHELRTPATAVFGVFATINGRGDELAPELREELMRIGYEQADRLRRLLEELLDLSRLDAHTIALEPRPIVLRSVVAAIVQQAVPPATSVEIAIPEDLAVVVDPVVLDRVLSNLLINAVRYGAPPIVVSAEQRSQHLRLVVEDAGPGVPEELRLRLFERFATGGGSGSSGLGLAIARAYARAHGGDVIYEPRDRGARFELIVSQG